MTAGQAREKANHYLNSLEKEIIDLIAAITRAAEQGKLEVKIPRHVSEGAKDNLKTLGYEVCRIGTGNDHHIEWSGIKPDFNKKPCHKY